MVKAKRCKSWACSNCNKPYVRKDFADACCTCRSCGGPGEYIGTSIQRCKRCQVKEALPRVREELKIVRRELASLEASAKELGLEFGDEK